MSKVLLLGSRQDEHIAHIHESLLNKGRDCVVLDTREYPQQMQICFDPTRGHATLENKDGVLHSNEISSVYWRTYQGVFPKPVNQSEIDDIAHRDSTSLMWTFLGSLNADWYNSREAYEFHKEKPRQLAAVQQMGIRIPETLVTNHRDASRTFVKQHPTSIFKPVCGGALTEIVSENHLMAGQLDAAYQCAPVTLQRYIDGTNIRTYVIEDKVFSAEIRTDQKDFRADIGAELIPMEVPDTIRAWAIKVCKGLALRWTAIDWRRNPAGEYFYLEANPSPMFLHFQNVTGFPISHSLVECLTQNR